MISCVQATPGRYNDQKTRDHMKILMVLDREFPPDIRVENQVEALTGAGHQVDIACYTRKGRQAVDTFSKARVFRKPIGTFIYKSSVGCLRFPFYFTFWRSFVFDLCRDNTYDAVHIHDLPLALIGGELKREKGIRFVLDLHENWPALLNVSDHTSTLPGRLLSSDRQWRKYEVDMCSLADEIIVVVEEARARLTGLGIEGNKITVVSNTLNGNSFVMPGLSPDPSFFTLLYAGGINRHRGLQDVIMALPEVKTIRPVRLFIAGEGKYIGRLREIARNKEVGDQVHFTGWLAFEKMNELMGRADICLIPHLKSEHTDYTVPHKLFQYMYARKTVVASDCLPLKRIIENSGCGKIYSSGSSGDLAGLLSDLSSGYEELIEMGLRGHRSVKDNYMWEKDAGRLVGIYNNAN